MPDIAISPLTLASLAGTVLLFLLLAYSRRLRGRVRTLLRSEVLVAATCLGALTFLLVARDLRWGRSDIITLLGLAVSLVLSFFAGEYFRRARSIRVAIAIPSLRPFHRELREGLREYLGTNRYVIKDPYAELDMSEEDLSSYARVLSMSLSEKPDVLVICAPTAEIADNPAQVESLMTFARRGGHVIFIESIPSMETLSSIGDCSTIVSDSSRAAEITANLVARLLVERHAEPGNVLLIPGPSHSRPARDRQTALESRLPDTVVVRCEPALTWTSSEAERLVRSTVRDDFRPDVIVCGNDDMARGAANAIHELMAEAPPAIIGHDGLHDTVVAIRDPWSPISGTIRIPPAAFGHAAGGIIEVLRARWAAISPWYRPQGRSPVQIVLPITGANLITVDNAPLRLRG
jgi:ABC-type sugar transport system substrate-binding protein